MKTRAIKTTALMGFGVLAACLLILAFPALAFASEDGGGAGIATILPKMEEFIPMLVCFIILVLILGKFGWPMFEGMMDKRANMIKESLEKSEEARVESERVLAEYKQQLAEAKTTAAQIVADAKNTGEAVKADITAKAHDEANTMVEKAKIAINAEKKAAIAELQGSVADTTIAVASRLIGNDLNDDEHRKIIEHYVNEAGNFNAN